MKSSFFWCDNRQDITSVETKDTISIREPKPDNDISYLQAKKVAIESKERDITVTVEPIGILPATFQVHRNALSVKF